MKQKKTLFSPFALALLTTLIVTMGCSLFTLKLPGVVNHPQPQLKVDTQPFVDAGCSQGNGMSRCPPDSPLGNLGCLAIGNPEDYLGGLTPAYPINICLTRSPSPAQPLAEDQFIYKDGCMLRNYIRYVIYKDDQFQLIASLEALQETYAPIETEEEALSFAAAASGLSANFGMETNRKYQYFVEKIEDSYARKVDDGYRVHLFDYKLCGCGPHPTFSVDYLLTPDGQLQEISRTKIFQDPEQDSLCID